MLWFYSYAVSIFSRLLTNKVTKEATNVKICSRLVLDSIGFEVSIFKYRIYYEPGMRFFIEWY